ncbi:glycoside hydrolase family protein [Vibrio mediterranei]
MLNRIQQKFSQSLVYKGRFLETPNQHVWGTSGFVDEDGRVHVYFSTWSVDDARAAWVINCKVNYATAETFEAEFVDHGTVLEGAGGDAWDAWSIHNPCVHKVGDKYVMLYMGSCGKNIPLTKTELSLAILDLEAKGQFKVPEDNVTIVEGAVPDDQTLIWQYYMSAVENKRVGMAISDRPDGGFIRVGDKPIIDVGEHGEWDDLVISNPAFCVTPEGKFNIYYKAWDLRTWHTVHGNRKYGVATSVSLTGPYEKSKANPIIDFEPLGNNRQLEDATVFYFENQFHMIARDMGVNDNARGIIMSSEDGIHFSDPQLAYHEVAHYVDEPRFGLRREGRYERPQIIKDHNELPIALVGAAMGGKYGTSSPALFMIDHETLLEG